MKTWRYAGFGLALCAGAAAGLSIARGGATPGVSTGVVPPPAAPIVTTRWRYAPPPDAVLASIQHDVAALSTSYREASSGLFRRQFGR